LKIAWPNTDVQWGALSEWLLIDHLELTLSLAKKIQAFNSSRKFDILDKTEVHIKRQF